MEVIRSRRGGNREIISNSSPDGAKVFMQPKVKPIRKVQIVYYLTRNGLLEHPHYMEVTHLANQPLRLKDVIDRLIVLRGKGMPSLYSWSCKRSYKNAYVWNDLAENDVIYPADGAEVVLKGSELVEICSEKFQRLNVNIQSKRKPMTPNLHKTTYEHHQSEDQEEQEQEQQEEDYEEEEEKTSYTSSTTPHSRCSRGVSTDEFEEQEQQNNKSQTRDHHQTASSLLRREKPDQTSNSNMSKRFEDGDGDENPSHSDPPSRNNSVLLQLISCGNLAVSKAKNVPSLKQPPAGKNSNVNGGLHKGVLCKRAVKVAEDEDIINYMSENPRFGNFQSEEKEYFSGSIVESASKDEIQPVLKKSNSYNEERRSSRAGLREAIQEEEEEDQKRSSFNFGVKGKCIPRKKSSSSSSKKIRKIK